MKKKIKTKRRAKNKSGRTVVKKELLRTLLDSFMLEAIDEFVPAQRKGTIKGEKIGYSFQKYSALFYLMRNWPLKEVARAAGVSYGVLRKWKTEKEFMKNHHDLQTKFSYAFSGHIIRQHRKVLSGEIDGPLDFENDPLFADVDSYGEPLRQLIKDYVLKDILKGRTTPARIFRFFEGSTVAGYEHIEVSDVNGFRAIYDVVNLVYSKEGYRLKRELYQNLEPQMSKIVFDDLIAFIEQKSHTKEDRLEARGNIKFLEWLINDPDFK